MGFDTVVATINDMIVRAKEDAGVDPSTPLVTLVSDLYLYQLNLT